MKETNFTQRQAYNERIFNKIVGKKEPSDNVVATAIVVGLVMLKFFIILSL